MSYKPIITKKAIIFELYKPIYGSFYAIWEKWIQIAIERKLKLVIKTPEGTATFTVNEFLKKAKRLKRYYKNPNEPMIFWGLDLLPYIKQRDQRKKMEKKFNDEEVFISFLEKLKEKDPEKFNFLKERIK